MAIRLSGLNSGLDTDSIVKELVSAYSTKKDKYVKSQTKLEWKMDAWKDLNKKVNSFYKKLGNLRFSTAYVKKKTTCSDTTKATVTATNSAINSTQSLEILDVAQTGYLTGARLGSNVTGSTKMSELSPSFTGGTVAVTADGATTNVNVTADMTMDDFVNALKDAGVSASYDAANRRMFISAKESGAENDFALTATDDGGIAALKAMGIYTRSNADHAAYQAWADFGTVTEADGTTRDATQADIENILNTAASYQADENHADSIAYLQSENAAILTENTNLQKAYDYGIAYSSMKNLLSYGDDPANPGTANLTGAEQQELEELLSLSDLNADQTARTEELKTKLNLSDENWTKLKTAAHTVAEYEGTDDASCVDTAVRDEVHAAYTAGTLTSDGGWIAAKQDEMQANTNQVTANVQIINEKQAYLDKYALLTDAVPESAGNTAARAQAIMEKIAFAKDQLTLSGSDTSDAATDGTGAKRIVGTNAVIELNGAKYESSSNSITVNGITITALQKTNGQPITISSQTDAQGMYDTIKDLMKEYNTLIKEMDSLYNAASAKGYEPLTDDEKDAMSDTEVEKWEKKIKDAVLRRDDTLGSVMNLMTTNMAKSFTLSDGKNYSLSSFGIKTQGYLSAAENEGSCFHIDGDSEDEISSGNKDKLMTAIQQDPDMVEEFFKKLSDNLYTELDNKMKTSRLNSSFTIYHDKVMKQEYDDYTDMIKKWEEKISDMEERYYKQFSAMETALAKLQSSTNALSGLLGS